MPRLFLLPLFLICYVNMLVAAKGQLQGEALTFNKQHRKYYLFVPDSVTDRAPLLVLFHGAGRNGMSLINAWQELASKKGIILAAPDSAHSREWNPQNDSPEFVHEIVEAVKTKCQVRPQRVYLFGHSAGAVYALYLSLAESEYFAAAAIHAGELLGNDDRLIRGARRKIPIAIWIGTRDEYFSLADVRATANALTKNGFPVQLKEMPGEGHNYYIHSGEVNRAAWDFLSKYELQGEPYYQSYSK
ncbi:MAG TPA: dienelactone hydrolase family protein [Terriglobales bacterium]|nr:dienelactone hydrolase family protein [Terriglobales bacterium]